MTKTPATPQTSSPADAPQARRRTLAHGAESRRRILDAAFDVASHYGYEGATMSRITKQAGLPASSVYWQFENKDQLLAAVVRETYDAWRAENQVWDTPMAPTLDESMRAALEPLARALVDHPRFWRLGLMLALEQRVEDVAARDEFKAARADTLGKLEAWWRAALPQCGYEVADSAAPTLAMLTLASADGLFVASQIDPGLDSDRLVSLLPIGLVAMAERLAQEHASTARPAKSSRSRKTS